MLFNKLLKSKWTSVDKYKGWYHYQVLNIFKKDRKVELYAICRKEIKIVLSISELKNKSKWIAGWKDIIN
tara:strand:+ start:541 stop:750 length:210 start_codon:yes stop_codon:yes gene_type:complete